MNSSPSKEELLDMLKQEPSIADSPSITNNEETDFFENQNNM